MSDPNLHWDGQRWWRWDGSAWTVAAQPAAPRAAPPAPPTAAPPPVATPLAPPADGPSSKTGLIIALSVGGGVLVFGLLLILVAVAGRGSQTPPESSQPPVASSPPSSTTPTPTPSPSASAPVSASCAPSSPADVAGITLGLTGSARSLAGAQTIVVLLDEQVDGWPLRLVAARIQPGGAVGVWGLGTAASPTGVLWAVNTAASAQSYWGKAAATDPRIAQVVQQLAASQSAADVVACVK